MGAKTPPTINDRMLAARNAVALNCAPQDGPMFDDLLSECENCRCEMDDKGDVWDSRQYWWENAQKEAFLVWLDSR